MKITIHGPAAGYGPSGFIESWAPDQLVEINDSDKKAVAWARVRLNTGLATLVEDVKPAAKPETAPRSPSRRAGE